MEKHKLDLAVHGCATTLSYTDVIMCVIVAQNHMDMKIL